MLKNSDSSNRRQRQSQSYSMAENNQPPLQSSLKNNIPSFISAIRSNKLMEFLTITAYLVMFIALMLFLLIDRGYALMPVITLMMNDISYLFRRCLDSFLENYESASDEDRK